MIYKILWFEDTDESFATLSRRIARYVRGKNLECTIDRISGERDFDIAQYNLNCYEVLVVDLKLAHGSQGHNIIQTIRNSNYVNDILFYSAEGVSVLEDIMRRYRLEGVFLAERDNNLLLQKLQQLIDKSIRRSENVINIRGLVMDETSKFDAQMIEIFAGANHFLNDDEKQLLRNYVVKELLQKHIEETNQWAGNHIQQASFDLSEVARHRSFTSMMKAKLLNRLINLQDNDSIKEATIRCKEYLPGAYERNKIAFVKDFDRRILQFRNRLAHVKQVDSEIPVFIGTIDGNDYFCDADFCNMMRSSLLDYGKWFDSLTEILAMYLDDK